MKADKAKLNTFGSAWGSLELTEQMPLGEYRVHVLGRRPQARHRQRHAVPARRIQTARVQSQREDARRKWAAESVSRRRKSRGEDSGGLLFRRAGGERERRSARLSKSILAVRGIGLVTIPGFTKTWTTASRAGAAVAAAGRSSNARRSRPTPRARPRSPSTRRATPDRISSIASRRA